MNLISVNCMEKTCPVPLIEARKAIRNAEKGDIIEIIGNHEPSKEEIPMAMRALEQEVLEVTEVGNVWKIRIRKN